VNKNKF